MKTITASIHALNNPTRECDLTEKDAENFVQWVYELKDNNFDPGVMFYPRTIMCRAQAGEEPIVYLPLQPVLMFESLAPKPGLSSRQTAMALWKIGEAVDKAALETGFREAYFFTNDEREAQVCALHGWKIAMYDDKQKAWLMKHKISEPKKEESPLPEAKVEASGQ